MLKSENLIPLMGGAYQARSTIADYEICENLFPEINPQTTDAPTPVTNFQREGKRPLSDPPVLGPGRGLFTLSNGALISVVGNAVYWVDNNWLHNYVGTIGNLSTPVSISDNGTTAVIVDGSPNGWTMPLSTKIVEPLVDGTGTFVGATRVDFCDTFLAFNAPGTNGWYTSLNNEVSFSALMQANKDSNPDPIVTLAFNIRQPWLIGTKSTEIWYNAGATPFAYNEWPNVFIPYGIAAPYSLTRADISLFWLSQNEQGQALAVQTKGYGVQAISTRALEYEWTNYPTVADCIAGSFQQGGHTFVVFHFPSADKSWAYDLSTQQWHRRTWVDHNGVAHREKVAFYASVGVSGGYPKTVVGQDWSTGSLYALDPQFYTDAGSPIVCRRTFPHILKDMNEITHVSFVADFETGAGTDDNSTPVLCMRYSNDGGNKWSPYREKPLPPGAYRRIMRWRGLGMARDRVYELMWSFPGPSALQGAYVDPIEHGS